MYVHLKSSRFAILENGTLFSIGKPFFLPEPQFSQHNARYQAQIFLIFFLNFYLFVFFNSTFNYLGLTLAINVIFSIMNPQMNIK